MSQLVTRREALTQMIGAAATLMIPPIASDAQPVVARDFGGTLSYDGRFYVACGGFGGLDFNRLIVNYIQKIKRIPRGYQADKPLITVEFHGIDSWKLEKFYRYFLKFLDHKLPCDYLTMIDIGKHNSPGYDLRMNLFGVKPVPEAIAPVSIEPSTGSKLYTISGLWNMESPRHVRVKMPCLTLQVSGIQLWTHNSDGSKQTLIDTMIPEEAERLAKAHFRKIWFGDTADLWDSIAPARIVEFAGESQSSLAS